MIDITIYYILPQENTYKTDILRFNITISKTKTIA